MADSGDGKSCDFYGVLGLEKECTTQELRNAYKRLALRWHPDRCSGNPRSVEEAKKKFQSIQEAYSVLSDSNKRFSYDIGMYHNDDSDDNDMADFLSEMASMMNQTKPSVSSCSMFQTSTAVASSTSLLIQENGEESFEQLQDLFDEMIRDDADLTNLSPYSSSSRSSSSSSSFYSASFNSYEKNSNSNRKRHSTDFYAQSDIIGTHAQFQNLHFGSGNVSTSSSSGNGRKIKRRNSGSVIP